MEDHVSSREDEAVRANGHSEAELADVSAATPEGYLHRVTERRAGMASARLPESAWPLIDSEVMVGLKDVKVAMVLSPNHHWPVEVEGLLVQHRRLPLGAHAEVSVTAGDREVVTEKFYLPTHRMPDVMEAHRKLAEVNSEILVNEQLRTRAMEVFYPELSEEYDLWYRIAIDEHGLLNYAIHIGPCEHQELKQKIEGALQL